MLISSDMPKKRETRFLFLVIVTLSFAVVLISVRNNSIWIDESTTWFLVSKSSISEMFSQLMRISGSEKQMPLYLVYEFLWTKVFGFSEFALRLSNAPFAMIYLYFGYAISRSISSRMCSLYYMLFLFNPMLIYYLNEARPYIIMLSMATAILYYSEYSESICKCIPKLLLAFFVGFGSHMLFAVVLVVPICSLLFHKGEIKRLLLEIPRWSLLLVLPIVLLIAYYSFSILCLPNETIGNAYGSILSSFLVSFYYLFGFGGLLFSRDDIRVFNFHNVSWYGVLFALVLLFLLLFLFIILIKSFLNKKIKKRECSLLLSLSLICLFFALIGVVLDFSFWDRHLIILSPIVLALIVKCIDMTQSRRKRSLIIIISAVFLLSSLRSIFLYYYQHEDYKNALNDNKSIVLAQGYYYVFKYYGYDYVPFDSFSDYDTQVCNISGYSFEEVCNAINSLPDNKRIIILLSNRASLDSKKLRTEDFKIESRSVEESDKYIGLKTIIIQ